MWNYVGLIFHLQFLFQADVFMFRYEFEWEIEKIDVLNSWKFRSKKNTVVYNEKDLKNQVYPSIVSSLHSGGVAL